MNTAICTLFEGHYHHGVAVLINSLQKNGFRGNIFIGYRGEIAPWAHLAYLNPALNWEGAKTLEIGNDIILHFLPVLSEYHLTNYKPDFMLKLWEGPALNMDAMFYFDPDIIVRCNWNFFEKWVSFGVALVHEISSNDMVANNPIRGMWAEIIEENEEKVLNTQTSYINAGFFGVHKKQIHFLKMYSKFVHLSVKKYNMNLTVFNFTNRTDPFFAKDQDALNIATMCTTSDLSEIGPEGMDFLYGGFTMSHAIGSPKPWKKKYLLSALKGITPTLADKAFWSYAGYPIETVDSKTIKFKNFSLKLASFIGRVYLKR